MTSSGENLVSAIPACDMQQSISKAAGRSCNEQDEIINPYAEQYWLVFHLLLTLFSVNYLHCTFCYFMANCNNMVMLINAY